MLNIDFNIDSTAEIPSRPAGFLMRNSQIPGLRSSQIACLCRSSHGRRARFAVLLWIFSVANFANAENNSLNESLDINPQDRFDDATKHDITPVWNPINRALQRDVDSQTENDKLISQELDKTDITKVKTIDNQVSHPPEELPETGDSRNDEGIKGEKTDIAPPSPEKGLDKRRHIL